MYNFAERLKLLRKENRLTQKQVAERIRATERAVRRYEAGDIKPGFDAINSLADTFNVSADYLLGRSDNPARL